MSQQQKDGEDRMKKICTILVSALLVSILSACGNTNSNSNTISVVELTEREKALLDTTSDISYVFDYTVDREYKQASVWIERYELGVLVDDKISHITTQVDEEGLIIFATVRQKHGLFNIGISSKDDLVSINGFDTKSDGLDDMLRVWGDFEEGKTSTEGEIVLASICYSNDDSMGSLTSDFYKDIAANLNQLEDYDVAYILKAEFIN